MQVASRTQSTGHVASAAPSPRRSLVCLARATPTGRPQTSSTLSQTQPSNQCMITAKDNYANLCSNMGDVKHRPVSGYAGRWSRYQGGSLSNLLAEGDIIYGFKSKEGQPGITQVWKAEEGDLNSPKLQSQRDTLPQLQKDPLQLQLCMDTLIIEVSADAPLVEPSFAHVPVAKLPTSMKTLAVPDRGNLVVTGGLPAITGTTGEDAEHADTIKGHPNAARSWFNRLYIRAPGPQEGNSSRWSVMLHYDTTTGELLTHYHTWETGIFPHPHSLKEVFTPGAHKQLMQQEQHRHSSIKPIQSISAFIQDIQHTAQYHSRTLDYTADGSQCTLTITSGPANQSPANAHSGRSPDSQGVDTIVAGGPSPVEVWYDSRCYFKAPRSLDPDMLAGEHVILEAGVVMPAHRSRTTGADASGAGAGGLVRWLVCYSSTGDRRMKWARNETFTLAQ